MVNRETWNIFPNTSAIAKYEFLSQTIHIDKYDRKKFDISIPEHKKVLFHEYSHLYDHFQTLWGIKNICMIYNAFNARLIENEQHFFHITDLYDDLKKVKSSRFYRVNGIDIYNYTGKWRIQYSVGLRYNKDGILNENSPIIFMRFNKENGELLTRVPLSIESILESRAMMCEFSVDIQELVNQKKVENLIVEQKLFENKCKEWLYNVDLATYSVATHFLANEFGYSDILDAYYETFLFGTLALNLPNKYFKNIHIDKETRTLFKGRENKFVENFDRTFLFYVLIKNSSLNNMKISIETIDEVLKVSNLPNWNTIVDDIINDVGKMKNQLINGPLKHIAVQRCDECIKNFMGDKKGLLKISLTHNVKTLPIIFGDDITGLFCDWYERICNVEGLLLEFLDCCGY